MPKVGYVIVPWRVLQNLALKSEPPNFFGGEKTSCWKKCVASTPCLSTSNSNPTKPQNPEPVSVFIIPACCERSPGKGGKLLEGTTHDQPKQVESRGETTTELQFCSEEIHPKTTSLTGNPSKLLYIVHQIIKFDQRAPNVFYFKRPLAKRFLNDFPFLNKNLRCEGLWVASAYHFCWMCEKDDL